MPELAEKDQGFSPPTQSVRETTKWLTTALAAVGGVLIAGLQLKDLSRASAGWRAVAVFGVLVALAAVGAAVQSAASVLAAQVATFGQILDLQLVGAPASQAGEQDESGRTIRLIETKRQELAKSLAEERPSEKTVLEEREEELAALEAAVDRVLRLVNDRAATWAYSRFRQRLGRLVPIAAAGVVLFAVATTQGEELAAGVSQPLQVDVVLSDQGRRKYEAGLGKDCVNDVIDGVAVAGRFPDVKVAVRPGPRQCRPDTLDLDGDLATVVPRPKG